MVPHPISRRPIRRLRVARPRGLGRGMRGLGLSLLPLLMLAPAPASAGPWPRDKGHAFVSLSHEGSGTDDGWTALYAEYGLTPRWTLALDMGQSADKTTALLIVQRAVGAQDGPGRLAFSSGIGLETGPGSQAFGMMGAAWGRSLGTPLGPGWLAVEPQLRMGVALSEDWPPTLVLDVDGTLATTASAKLDVTLGATLRPGLIVMGQLLAEQQRDGEPRARFVAAAVRSVGGRARLQLGLSTPVTGEGETALKLGTWLEF